MTAELRERRQRRIEDGPELVITESALWWMAALTIANQRDAAENGETT